MLTSLSVLDYIDVRADQTSAEAIQASREQILAAECYGFTRYWVTEHHSSFGASTVPALSLAVLAQSTSEIRLGSGALLLPNYSPFTAAEHFAFLEAAFPGRVDLGVGRAGGTSAAVLDELHGHQPARAASNFETDLERLVAHLSLQGVEFPPAGPGARLLATPRPSSKPEIWLLGSSVTSAALAGRLGVPYAYASHFGASQTKLAFQTYRENLVSPSKLSRSRALATVNVSISRSDDLSQLVARPFVVREVGLITGRAELLQPMSIEQAARVRFSSKELALADEIVGRSFVGRADDVASRLRGFAELNGADELMINLVSGEYDSSERNQNAQRLETLASLARVFPDLLTP